MVFEEISNFERYGGIVEFDPNGNVESIHILDSTLSELPKRWDSAIEALNVLEQRARAQGSTMFLTEIIHRHETRPFGEFMDDPLMVVPIGARITFLNHVDAMAYKMRWL